MQSPAFSPQPNHWFVERIREKTLCRLGFKLFLCRCIFWQIPKRRAWVRWRMLASRCWSLQGRFNMRCQLLRWANYSLVELPGGRGIRISLIPGVVWGMGGWKSKWVHESINIPWQEVNEKAEWAHIRVFPATLLYMESLLLLLFNYPYFL